jgi:hypothetical protein
MPDIQERIPLARKWVENRPHMHVEVVPVAYTFQNGYLAPRYRVTLITTVRDTSVPVQSDVGFSPPRVLVHLIERMQGRPLTQNDVNMRQ